MKPRKVELGEDGQAMVEFALTFPLLLTMITLIMQFALAFNGTALVRYAAFNAARAAAVHLPLNDNNGDDTDVHTKARMAAALSMAPVSPSMFSGTFPGAMPGTIPNLNLSKRFAYAWGTLSLLPGSILIQSKSDFDSGSTGNSRNWEVRDPVHVTVNYYFALLIPPADQFLWLVGGGSSDGNSLALKGMTGGKLKALKMVGKSAFIYTGLDDVQE